MKIYSKDNLRRPYLKLREFFRVVAQINISHIGWIDSDWVVKIKGKFNKDEKEIR